MSEPLKYISVKIESFEYRPDERGYLAQFNKINVLETCVADTPEERAKAAHLTNITLNANSSWPRREP